MVGMAGTEMAEMEMAEMEMEETLGAMGIQTEK
jgi:hypothetical protein